MEGATLATVAAGALGKIGASAIPALKTPLHDPDWRTRIVTLWAFRIMRAGASKAFAELLPMLKDPNPNVRSAATEVFGAMGPLAEKAIPDLVVLLDDKAAGDQRGAYGYGGPVYKGVVWNLAIIGEPALKPALAHPDPEVRAWAQRWLAELKKKEAQGDKLPGAY
jgi:HEAT repeat protein